jgi:hypothetical protein
VVTKTLTDAWTPPLTWTPVGTITGVILALTAASVFAPTTWLLATDDR